MELYFIRHGETEYNRRHVHQPSTAPLNTRGRLQAEDRRVIVGQIEPEVVLVSTMTRAVETAAIITTDIECNIEEHDLFVELQRPPHLFNRKHFGFFSIWYMLQWFFNFDPGYWERNGGESRRAFLDRLEAAKQYLESRSESSAMVVSHSVFINFFVAHLCDARPIPLWRAILLLLKIKTMDNAGVVKVMYDRAASIGVCAWQLDTNFKG